VRVVLDTNVIVSAVLTPDGPCARIVDLLAAGALTVCADDRILAEHDEVLRRPALKIDPGNIEGLLDLVRSAALPVAALPLDVSLPDPDDLLFLEVATAAQAVLVTGNDRHYPRHSRFDVRILSPREFLDLIRRSS